MQKWSRLFLLICGLATSDAFALIAPWYQQYNHVMATLAKDPQVAVSELEDPVATSGNYLMRIDVSDEEKGKALVFLLNHKDFNAMRVDVKVFFQNMELTSAAKPSTVDEVQKLLLRALEGNPLFASVIYRDIGGPFSKVFVTFEPVVVQFFIDDIGDLFGHANFIAASSFNSLLNFRAVDIVEVVATTEPSTL